MRNLVMAGAAVLAISAMSSGAYAGGSHGGGATALGAKALTGCLIIGALATTQTNCGFNIVPKGSYKHSNDENTQTITQKNKAQFTKSYGRPPVKQSVEVTSMPNGNSGHGGGLLQLNGALNVVESGSGNDQSIDQKNYYKGPEPKHDSVVQLNVGVNTAAGDYNVQSIEQSNSISYSSGHK